MEQKKEKLHLKVKDIDNRFGAKQVKEYIFLEVSDPKEYIEIKSILKSIYSKAKDFENTDELAKVFTNMKNRDKVLLIFGMIDALLDGPMNFYLDEKEDKRLAKRRKIIVKILKRSHDMLRFNEHTDKELFGKLEAYLNGEIEEFPTIGLNKNNTINPTVIHKSFFKFGVNYVSLLTMYEKLVNKQRKEGVRK